MNKLYSRGSTLPRLGGGVGAESSRADFKYRYLNNGYSYDSNISRLFLEIYCQYGQKMVKKYWVEKKLQSIPEHLLTLNFDKKRKKKNK